jgi:hypothetical protein
MTDELHATPEPWTAIDYLDGSAGIIGPDGDMVAQVYGNLAEEGDAFCNALLMAAAPKMAKVLKEARDFMASLPVYQLPDGTFNGIEAALLAAGVEHG